MNKAAREASATGVLEYCQGASIMRSGTDGVLAQRRICIIILSYAIIHVRRGIYFVLDKVDVNVVTLPRNTEARFVYQ